MNFGAQHQRGLGLIEVLIALVVLSVGMLAMGRLLALALREIEISRARGVATQLAREKIEDLRSFAQLDAGPAGVFGFDEMGDASGGAEAVDGRLLLSAGAVEFDGLHFTRDWKVRAFYFCEPETAASTSQCTPPHRHADLFWITMTLSWDGIDSLANLVVIESAIVGLEPGLSSQALVRPVPVPAPGD